MKIAYNDILEVIIEFEKNSYTFIQSDIYYLKLEENIFSTFITGILQIYDRESFFETVSFSGNEKIIIKYGRNEIIEKKFEIYNTDEISAQRPVTETILQIYTFQIVEEGFIAYSQRKFSKSWSNTKISEIVKHILKHMVGIETVQKWEDSNERIDFIMPYCTPASALRWLMRRASGSDSGLPGFLLFSNAKGMNFVTIETLLQSKEIEKDEGKIMDYRFDSYGTYYPNKIMSWKQHGINSLSMKSLRGGINSGYDSLINQYIEYHWNYKDIVDKYTSFGTYTLFPNIGQNDVKISFEGDVDSDSLKNIIMSDFIHRYVRQNLLTIDVQFAHERKCAGMIANVYYPSGLQGEIINKELDGKWLILGITNFWSQEYNPVWRQSLTFAKNGYTDSNNRDLYKAKKVDMEVTAKKILKV